MDKKRIRPIADIYEECALFWTQHRSKSPFFEKKYMDWMLQSLSPGDFVLDIGCGSGFPIADYFVKNKMQVTGVDASAAMIEIAQKSSADATWIVADMRKLNLNKKFHAIVAWDSFFHLQFSDQEIMFPIFKNHLRPGGVLVFTSGPSKGEVIGDMNGHPLFHASLSPEEYQSLLRTNGFEVVNYTPEDIDCGGHTVWCCRLIK